MNMLVMKTGEENRTLPVVDDTKSFCLHANCVNWEENHLPANRSIACVLIPAPEGYEIVSKGEMKGPKPKGTCYWTGISWQDADQGLWGSKSVYARPICPKPKLTEKALKIREKMKELLELMDLDPEKVLIPLK